MYDNSIRSQKSGRIWSFRYTEYSFQWFPIMKTYLLKYYCLEAHRSGQKGVLLHIKQYHIIAYSPIKSNEISPIPMYYFIAGCIVIFCFCSPIKYENHRNRYRGYCAWRYKYNKNIRRNYLITCIMYYIDRSVCKYSICCYACLLTGE